MRRRPLRARAARSCAAVFAVGAALTSVAFVVVRGDVERLTRQRIDHPAGQALLGVQQMTAAVDQVLATANGVYATSGGDARRFVAVLGPDVNASSTLAGMTLVVADDQGVRRAATVGSTPLLAGKERAVLDTTTTSTLLANRRDRAGYHLGFAARVGHGDAAVFLEIRLPLTTPTTLPFALVPTGPRRGAADIVLGNVANLSGLSRWNQTVDIGGREFALLVRAGSAPSGWLGLSLPQLVLLVGLALTTLAAGIAIVVARRTYAMEHLSVQNRELDEALERQRQVEAELRAWQARFRTILRDSPDVIALLDVDAGTCEVLNRTDFFGHPLETLAEKDGLYGLVHPEDRADADAHWQRLHALEPDRVCETTLRLRDGAGTARYARLRFSPLNLEDDSSQTLLGAISDVTDEWTNQLREAELQEALRRSQRLEAVGQLAGGVAHDFNNVLAAVQASVELLMDDVPPGRPREYADEIHRAAGRGAALVRQLLTFAQRDRAEPRTVDLNEVIVGMEPLLRRSLGEQVQLHVSRTECSCLVEVDPTHLEQVILNLAVNARDAMPGGGVLWIATTIEYDDTGGTNDRVVLSVTDTGTGIAPDVRERMFDPFMTTKEPGKGTGLGLATVMSIVREVAGEINVVTEVGQGTTFEISFARCTGVARSPDEPVAADHFDGCGRRILLVEDDAAVRAALAHTLERRHFTVVTAVDASQALPIVEQQAFDLVLTDAVMPGMSGAALVEHLHATHPELRVILMSGYSRGLVDASSIASSRQQLRKPFTTAELMRAIRTALEQPSDKESLSEELTKLSGS
ncbi:MAG TPA: ATP-binding protein [Acidimicrobiia bacterium]|nr:ATP-binding protein [Acidimicrobiia bacterium]